MLGGGVGIGVRVYHLGGAEGGAEGEKGEAVGVQFWNTCTILILAVYILNYDQK